MAYEVVMPYHLHMPSYFLETFTEYPFFIHKVDIRACNQHKALRKTKKRPFPSTETIVINFKEQNCIA